MARRTYGGSYENPTGGLVDFTAFSRGLATGFAPGLEFLQEQEKERKLEEAKREREEKIEKAKIELGAKNIRTAQARARDESATAGFNVNKQLQINAKNSRDYYLTASVDERKFFDNFYSTLNKAQVDKVSLMLGAYGNKNADFDSFRNNVALGTYIDKNNKVQNITHTGFIDALKNGNFTYEDNGKYNINEYNSFIKYKVEDGSDVIVDLGSINIEDVRENLTFKSDLQDLIKTEAGEVKNAVIGKPSISAEEVKLNLENTIVADVEELDDAEYNTFEHAFMQSYINSPKSLQTKFNGWDPKKSKSENIINLASILRQQNEDLTQEDAEDQAAFQIKQDKKNYLVNSLKDKALIASGQFIYDSNNRIIKRPVKKPEIDTNKLEQNQIKNLLESDLSSLNSANLVDNFKNRQYYVGDKIFQISDIQFVGPQNENEQRIRIYPIRVVNNAAIQYNAIVGWQEVNYIDVDLNNKNSVKTFMGNLYKDKSPEFLSILNDAINAGVQANSNTRPKQGGGILDNI